MSHRPFLPSVDNLLNHDDPMDVPGGGSRGYGNMHKSHRSSTSQHHAPSSSQSSSRYDAHNAKYSTGRSKPSSHRLDTSLSSSSRRHYDRDHPMLPSVHEVLRGTTPRHGRDAYHKLQSSPVSYTPLDGMDYDKPSHDMNSSSGAKKQGHPCERCGRLFTRKSDALKHIRVVHDRLKVFSCSVCGRKFARKDYCTKHEKSLHNITPPPTQYQIRRQLAKEQAEKGHKSSHKGGK